MGFPQAVHWCCSRWCGSPWSHHRSTRGDLALRSSDRPVQIESFHLIYDACYYHFGLLIIKYSRGSFCDCLVELGRDNLLSGSNSRSTRFGLIGWVRPQQSHDDRLSSMMGRHSFFAIKPSFHFYLYFTVRKCLFWPCGFWCCRSGSIEA